MTTNEMDGEAQVRDQTYSTLDAEGFASLQELVDKPPATTDRLRRLLTTKARWDAIGADNLASEKEVAGLLDGLLVPTAEACANRPSSSATAALGASILVGVPPTASRIL